MTTVMNKYVKERPDVTRTDPRARQRIVVGAADMISRRGLSATSIREMAKHAKAPLGSTYHYFPDGKQQLATEAVRYAGEMVAGALRQELEVGPLAGLQAFLRMWRGVILDTDYRAGCPVLAVAIEEPAEEECSPTLVAAAEVFQIWEDLFAASLREHGAVPDEAVRLSTLVVAALEGAVAMCRAKRSTEPLDHTAEQLQVRISATTRG